MEQKTDITDKTMKNSKTFYQHDRIEQLEVLEKLMDHFQKPPGKSYEYFDGVVDGINKVYRMLSNGEEFDITKLDSETIDTITS